MDRLTNRRKTYFLDLDGTLIRYVGDPLGRFDNPPELLPGVREFLVAAEYADANIIITTGRKESCREQTIQQLRQLNIPYSMLIMGIGGGERILVNDLKPDSNKPTATAINLVRDSGMENTDMGL